jgi:hypothetical protein
MTTKPANQRHLGPNNAFIGACIRVDEALARLTALRADHFGVEADKQRNWGEVGSAERIAELLEQAVAFAEGKPD